MESHTQLAALAKPAMYNSDHNAHCPQMSPRISFSNDFGDAQQIIKQERSSREAPVSSDFEFSVTNYSMMSADELFSKGRLLPFRDNCNNQMQRTLRDELMVGEEDEVSARPPKGYATRWKGLLGLKKSHSYGSKKGDKNNDGSVDSFAEGKRLSSVQEEPYKTSQEMGNGEGPSCRDEGMTRL